MTKASWSEPPSPCSQPGMADHAPNQEVVAGEGPAGEARFSRFSRSAGPGT